MSHPLVLVIWEDATSNGGWKSADILDGWIAEEAWKIHSVGYLLRDTKEYVVLAASWSKVDGQYGNLTRIPRALVRAMIRIEEPKETP